MPQSQIHEPKLVDPPYSFFDLASEFKDIKPLKRCLSVLRRLGVRTMVRSEWGSSDPSSYRDDEDEPESMAALLGRKLLGVKYVDLFFFRTPFTRKEQLEEHSDQFLGRILLKGYVLGDNIRWHVKQSVTYPEPKNDRYVCAYRAHKLSLESRQDIGFDVQGSWHCQQTRITNCCAHASIRTALNSHPRLCHSCPTHRVINESVGIDHNTRKAWDGLFAREIADILEKAGANPIVFQYGNNLPNTISFEQATYLAVESGFPAILGFRGGKGAHVVTVVGHTFNSDNWLPEADTDYALNIQTNLGYIPSAYWVDNFILQDDNFGPYYSLPVAYLREKVELVIAVTDLTNVQRFAHFAEIEAFVHLLTVLYEDIPDSKWTEIFRNHVRIQKAILRTTLATKDTYLTELLSLKAIDDPEDPFFKGLDDYLPDRFWITEYSVPELFTANRCKIGETITDMQSCDPLITRFPRCFMTVNRQMIEVYESHSDGYTPLRTIKRCALLPGVAGR